MTIDDSIVETCGTCPLMATVDNGHMHLCRDRLHSAQFIMNNPGRIQIGSAPSAPDVAISAKLAPVGHGQLACSRHPMLAAKLALATENALLALREQQRRAEDGRRLHEQFINAGGEC